MVHWGHALAEHIAIQASRPLADHADAYPELTPFTQDSLQDRGTHYRLSSIGGAEVVHFFQQQNTGYPK